MTLRVDAAGQQPQKPQKSGKGPEDLAKALGITVDKLKTMSRKDVEKLAQDKGVNLKEYGRPEQPPKGPNSVVNSGTAKDNPNIGYSENNPRGTIFK